MARQKRPVRARSTDSPALVHKRHPMCNALARRLRGLMTFVEKSQDSNCYVGVKIGDTPCWRISFDSQQGMWHEQLTKRTMVKSDMRQAVLEACTGRNVNLVLCRAAFLFFEGPDFRSPLDVSGRRDDGEGSGA